MSKKRMITKSVIFLLILAFILKIFSSLSIAMGYNANPLYNYSSYSIFQEPDNSIDVLSIGDSNVYSSIFPLVWWEQQGFTGYTSSTSVNASCSGTGICSVFLPKRFWFITASCSNTSWSFPSISDSCSCCVRNN